MDGKMPQIAGSFTLIKDLHHLQKYNSELMKPLKDFVMTWKQKND